MLKQSKKKNQSPMKKMLPAVCMLTLSAVMLSSATYAWFTMNKEVEVYGLQMTATTSDSLEISLGTNNGTAIDVTKVPGNDASEISWKKSIAIGEYYNTFGKLKPASTLNCATMYDATNVTNAGQTASQFVAVTKPAKRTADTTLDSAAKLATSENDDDAGYFIDIPVHLRTSKTNSGTATDAPIYCKMSITSADETSTDLYKAARVAFIPESGTANATVDTGEVAVSVCGATDTYYGNGPVSSTSEKTAADPAITTVDGATAFDTKLTIPLPDTGEYGQSDFIVRIWLEGESKFCQDKNASQSWNIDMRFGLTANDITSLTDTSAPLT